MANNLTSYIYLQPNMAESKFADVWKRTAFGAVFVLVTVSCIWFSAYSFVLAYGVFMLGALLEFYKLNGLRGTAQYWLGTFAGAAFFALTALALLQLVDFKWLLFPIVIVVGGVLAATFSKAESPFTQLGKMLAGLVYACFPFVALLFVGIDAYAAQDDIHRPFPILLFMVLVWSTDTFAYLSGKFFGKNKMAPSISPGKTWEGTSGGVFCSLLVAIGVSLFFPEEGLVTILTIWFAGSILAVLGDLSESKLKRSVNVKDSGIFMPGHGGFLDRFDSILLSAPLLMVYYLLLR
jgi:phosphatidate cytidylyltransferase